MQKKNCFCSFQKDIFGKTKLINMTEFSGSNNNTLLFVSCVSVEIFFDWVDKIVSCKQKLCLAVNNVQCK